MGKKGKVGKDRKDKFYKLAKETGFRSRAAFKLIQINRKYGFLQQSQVCIDLCAAPGGWMQVAKQNMPMSSIVIGVDLFQIRPIPGCISLIEDITSEKCKQSISRELQTWKADVVLHDGAPNVGKNWLFDAYQQICLTLTALKLSTNFLRSGGWFITKVFRSKDYNALLWVFKQLFKKVHATKPSASRKESAEIFVICQGYLAPAKIDSRFLDPKYVFEELDLESSKMVSLISSDKKRIKADGYTEKEFSQRKTILVSQFMQNINGLAALQGVSEIEFDDDSIRKHPKTSEEIIECCKDIKVLGRKDVRQLLKWWKDIRSEMYPKVTEKTSVINTEQEKELTAEEIEEKEFNDLQNHIEKLQVDATRDNKRKQKKVKLARQKLNEKLNLKMVIKGDAGPQEEDVEIFRLSQIRSMAELDRLQDQPPDFVPDNDLNSKLVDEFTPKYKKFSKEEFHLDDDGLYRDEEVSNEEGSSDESENINEESFGLSDNEADNIEMSNKGRKKASVHANSVTGLITDLDERDKNTKRRQRVQLWYEKDSIKDVDVGSDNDFDLDKLTNQYRHDGISVLGNTNVSPDIHIGKKARRRIKHLQERNPSNVHDETSLSSSSDKAGLAIGPTNKKTYKLNDAELALGAMMVRSQHTKQEIIESAWNRYAFNDENLPDWFVQDEALHMRKEIPVPKELEDEYQNKVKELNVRPIKKVMEAKARKKRRAMKRFEKAKKKAEAILENVDASSQEKVRQIKRLYKKAQDEKTEVSYVVTKKHLASKRVRRPAGIKGRFKVVDPRLKKDKRAALAKEKTKHRRKRH